MKKTQKENKKSTEEERGGTSSIADILNDYISSKNWASRIEETKAVTIYNDLPDKTIEGSRARYISRGTLAIIVSSPAVSFEISLRQSEIIEKINTELGANIVRKLRFNVGFIDNTK